MGLLFVIVVMLACCGASVWIIFKTIQRSKKAGALPFILSITFALLGLALGFFATFHFEYRLKPAIRVQGFPFPIAFFALEAGNWTDFIPPIPTLLFEMATNLLLWMALFLGAWRLLIACFRLKKP